MLPGQPKEAQALHSTASKIAACGEIVPRDSGVLPFKADFEYLVDQEFFGGDGVEQGRKQRALPRRGEPVGQ